MEPVIVIVGPTASGKTGVSIELAKLINGSIVSADSMQVYKYMNIGTAKPDEVERCGIDHYMIDILDPDEEFSVARYREMALKCIEEIIKQKKRPIVVGGTGLYINSLIHNISFSETIRDEKLREELKREAQTKGNRYLHDKLKEVDPEAAAKIHENDLKRIIRALEVYRHTNLPISKHKELSRLVPPFYTYLLFGLNWDREKLYQQIEKRVDAMIEAGLIDEVRSLIRMGYDLGNTARQAIGYKEVLKYLKGEYTLEETIYILKRDTRRYAKRQLTWFRHLEGIKWIDMDENTDYKTAARKIIDECIATYRVIL